MTYRPATRMANRYTRTNPAWLDTEAVVALLASTAAMPAAAGAVDIPQKEGVRFQSSDPRIRYQIVSRNLAIIPDGSFINTVNGRQTNIVVKPSDTVCISGKGFDQRRTKSIVGLFLPGKDRCRRVDEARVGYGLTVTESWLLVTIFEEYSVPRAAHRLSVARSTSRTHLQRIFDKTGARRQGNLLRMVTGA